MSTKIFVLERNLRARVFPGPFRAPFLSNVCRFQSAGRNEPRPGCRVYDVGRRSGAALSSSFEKKDRPVTALFTIASEKAAQRCWTAFGRGQFPRSYFPCAVI